MIISTDLSTHCRCRCRQKCAARLEHLAVHLFVVMTTIISVIGVTALLLIRLDVIQGRHHMTSHDVMQQNIISVDVITKFTLLL